METIRDFNQLVDYLRKSGRRQRVAVVCAHDKTNIFTIRKALDTGIADFIFIDSEDNAAAYDQFDNGDPHIKKVMLPSEQNLVTAATDMIRRGYADVLMKGMISSADLFRAIIDKEHGLLRPDTVLTHISVMQIPNYHKLLFITDPAVIPNPTQSQRVAMIDYAIAACHKFGIGRPKIALIHFIEKISTKFPVTLDYREIIKLSAQGRFGNAIIDGPTDVKCACDLASEKSKGIDSPLQGDADVLVFPGIESANVFYKAFTLFTKTVVANVLQGTDCPVIVTSRGDNVETKYYSLAMGCLTNQD